MNRRAITGTIFFLIVVICVVARCQAQSIYKPIDGGYICFTNDWVFIRCKTDTVDYDLFIIERDSVRTRVVYSVAYFQGFAGFWIDDNGAYLQIKTEGMRRSRTKRYMFLK